MIITDNTYSTVLENELVVIKIGAKWCGPCKTLDPIFHKVEKNKVIEPVLLGTIDADDCPEFLKQNVIRNVPTILFFKNNEIVNKHVGILTEEQLLSKIEELKNS